MLLHEWTLQSIWKSRASNYKEVNVIDQLCSVITKKSDRVGILSKLNVWSHKNPHAAIFSKILTIDIRLLAC